MIETLGLAGVAAALGIGMLIGLERERHKGRGDSRACAGLRTFAITALLGYGAMLVGGGLLVGIMAFGLAMLVCVAYWRSLSNDPGVTSEVALLTVLVLGALCSTAPELAIVIGVVIAGLLMYRQKVHHFARSQLTEAEMRDGLVLLIAALVVLPLAPDRFIGPYAAINLRTICTLTVLLMAVGAMGHIAVRTLGSRYGYAISAIASGFASSTMTIAAMGHLVTKEPEHIKILSAAAILSNLATVTQVGLILGAVDTGLLRHMWGPLLCGAAATALWPGLNVSHAYDRRQPADQGGWCVQSQAGPGRHVDHDRYHFSVVSDAQPLWRGRGDVDRDPYRFCRCAFLDGVHCLPGQGRAVAFRCHCRPRADCCQQ